MTDTEPMGIARQVAPMRIGVLIDFILPPPSHWNVRSDFLDAARITFDDATASGQLDRPVELVIREVEGLPRGTVKAVIDAYGELADEGCLGVFGPMISESAVPLREAIEDRFRIPAISWCGADEWHGEWTFSLSNGSLTDEPYVIANLIAQRGLRRAAVSYERSLIGQKYLRSFRDACRVEGITIVGEEAIAQSGVDATDVVDRTACHRARCPRAPRLRARGGRRERGPGRARLGSPALHGHVVGERLHERRDLPGPPRLDRARPVRRGQSRGAGVPRPLRGGHRSTARVLLADLRPRRRADVRGRAGQRGTAVAPRGDGGAGAGQDAPGRVRRAGHADLVRQLDPAGMDGRRLPHRPRGHARLPVDGLPRAVGRPALARPV